MEREEKSTTKVVQNIANNSNNSKQLNISNEKIRNLLFEQETKSLSTENNKTDFVGNQFVTVVPRDGANRIKINQIIKKLVINGSENFNSEIDQIPAIIPKNQILRGAQVSLGIFLLKSEQRLFKCLKPSTAKCLKFSTTAKF